MICAKCGAPGARRVRARWRCGNPACARYDLRLAGVDAERHAIPSAADRAAVAAALTPPFWVRWLAGPMFLIPTTAVVTVHRSDLPAAWEEIAGTLPFAVIGLLILASGGAGRRIAEERMADRRLRVDANAGCFAGLLIGIGSFAAFMLIGGPLLTWFRLRPLGLGIQDWSLIVLAAGGTFGSLWGLWQARKIRDAGGEPPDLPR